MRILLVLLCLLFTACSSQKVSEVNAPSYSNFTPYIVNVENTREKALGEKNKCMSGVYLDGEFNFSGIGDFERTTMTDNDVYIKRVGYNQEFPASFVIECRAKGKVPLIIFERGIANMEDMAKKCNSLAPYMLVAFNYGADIDMYNKSAEIFRRNAPYVALMWNVDYDENINMTPENKYVDWVMLNFNEGIADGVVKTEIAELRNVIKYFSGRAVAVNVSVENFSEKNYKYYTQQWNDEVKAIYSAVADYENVGLVNYVSNSDKNRIKGSSRLSESRLVWEGFQSAKAMLPDKRRWSSTDVVAYVSDNTAYVLNEDAKRLNIEEKYVSTKYAAIKNYSLDDSCRKMFVYLPKMLYNE